MSLSTLRTRLEGLLAEADIRVNGDRPWDPRIHDDRFYTRLFLHGSLGLGEAYMDGWWDCEALDEFFTRILRERLDQRLRPLTALALHLRARIVNLQQPRRAFEVGKRHYDIGNDFYAAMLDPSMTYSCGYWREASTLADAQRAKVDLVCRKLELQEDMRILDIGCGWGSAARHAAENYGVEVVGVTVSENQVKEATERCKGLPVEIRLQDYREIDEPFDRVFSIGMFEHVGYKNYRRFMEIVEKCLPPDGLAVLHTIGGNRSSSDGDPWLEKYIFPNSMLPSAKQITEAAEGLLTMEDWHNFGADYDRTLMNWHANFEEAWPRFAETYGDRFYRMWRYYLLSCAGSFRARKNQLWQIVYSPRGVLGGYRAPR